MPKIDHLTLRVSNWRKSRDWYIHNLDLELKFEVEEDNTAALSDESDFTLIVCETDAGALPPSCALTIQVSDVDAKFRELAGAGVAFVHPPQKVFWGYGAELLDPDGYAIRLWDPKSMRVKG